MDFRRRADVHEVMSSGFSASLPSIFVSAGALTGPDKDPRLGVQGGLLAGNG
jgi:hypothetical protein